ncbi:MAG: HAD-IA family hydrolase [Nitrospiraceae bacterium]|nr:HAD-IA family hydrolase [Nitrospiraceae bacterium]
MKLVRLFIFDLDGTLVDTLEDITASVNYTLTKLGRQPLAMDQVRRFVGDGLTALLTRALGDRQEFLADAEGIYTVHHSRNLSVRSKLYPGVAETLEQFGSMPMAVVSNKTKDFVQPLLDNLGIGRRFRMVLGADSGLPLKPAPDALLHIMRTLGVPAEDTVMVGDGTTDIRAGKAAGIATCAVTYGFRSEAELRQAGPDQVIHAFGELKNFFRAQG